MCFKLDRIALKRGMAERVGFEPTLEFPLNTLSKRAPSTTRPSLHRAVILVESNIGGGPVRGPSAVVPVVRTVFCDS